MLSFLLASLAQPWCTPDDCTICTQTFRSNLCSGSYGLTRANLPTAQFSSTLLSGTIPTELFRLTQLTQIFINRHRLSGTVPTEVGLLTLLERFSLRDNAISGTIPTELGRATQLSTLTTFMNFISGTLPSQLGNLANLYQVDASPHFY